MWVENFIICVIYFKYPLCSSIVLNTFNVGHRGCASLFSKIMTETASENFVKHLVYFKVESL